MNFLGHLLLTFPNQELTMGNLLGDLIRRKQARDLSPEILRGIALHHSIDNYTDRHPEVRSLIALLRMTHGKYAPVVVDILLDHILARQWELHADIPYSDFTQWVYALIPDYLDGLEEPVVMRLESMVRHQWVDGYDTVEKLHEVFVRMDRRAKFPSRFVQGIQDIQQHYELFSSVFASFYGGLKIALKEDLQTRPVYP